MLHTAPLTWRAVPITFGGHRTPRTRTETNVLDKRDPAQARRPSTQQTPEFSVLTRGGEGLGPAALAYAYLSTAHQRCCATFTAFGFRFDRRSCGVTLKWARTLLASLSDSAHARTADNSS